MCVCVHVWVGLCACRGGRACVYVRVRVALGVWAVCVWGESACGSVCVCPCVLGGSPSEAAGPPLRHMPLEEGLGRHGHPPILSWLGASLGKSGQLHPWAQKSSR